MQLLLAQRRLLCAKKQLYSPVLVHLEASSGLYSSQRTGKHRWRDLQSCERPSGLPCPAPNMTGVLA